MSPLLFAIYLNDLEAYFEAKCQGITLTENLGSRWPFANSRGANIYSNWRKIVDENGMQFASLAKENYSRIGYHIPNER